MEAKNEKMDAHSEEELRKFEALMEAAPNIREFPNGIAEFPVAELRQYAIDNDIGEGDAINYGVEFELAEPKKYNYRVGLFDYKNKVLIQHVYYVDVGGGPNNTDIREEILPSEMLTAAIMRRFLIGEAGVSGLASIDQYGQLWLDTRPEPNIQAILTVMLDPKGAGVEFESIDPTTKRLLSLCRLSYNGKSFYYDPVDPAEKLPLS